MQLCCARGSRQPENPPIHPTSNPNHAPLHPILPRRPNRLTITISLRHLASHAADHLATWRDWQQPHHGKTVCIDD
ncbi:hypothetical protein [Neisseria bacilliformis]|uniref:hypothetical protein n=1 Tax=Neisseria bacilliformis TaxID=267212 RepID=UPI000AF7DD1E|nr:hypothetical protein [Neisseria bacilliformis]